MNSKIYESLIHFVIGATIGRDDSHNHIHMKRVYDNSMIILQKLRLSGEVNPRDFNRIFSLVSAVSLLHDVSDHKYDPEGKAIVGMKTSLALIGFSSLDIELILKIIDRISYSKENKVLVNGGKLDWKEVLGDEGCLVRDIVSDADKIEAIGLEGVRRCMEYSKHYLEGKGKEVTEKILVERLVEHGKEKLFRLYDEFIRTTPGKDIAKKHHDIMVKETKRLAKQHDIDM